MTKNVKLRERMDFWNIKRHLWYRYFAQISTVAEGDFNGLERLYQVRLQGNKICSLNGYVWKYVIHNVTRSLKIWIYKLKSNDWVRFKNHRNKKHFPLEMFFITSVITDIGQIVKLFLYQLRQFINFDTCELVHDFGNISFKKVEKNVICLPEARSRRSRTICSCWIWAVIASNQCPPRIWGTPIDSPTSTSPTTASVRWVGRGKFWKKALKSTPLQADFSKFDSQKR